MAEIEVRDIQNSPKGTVALPEGFFSADVCESTVHTAVVSYLANQRQGTHATKTRGLVSGGGKKPFKQKHTGRARQGSIRSPLARKGGTIFGPQPREYRMKLPVAARRAGLRKALTMKLADGEVMVIDSISIEAPRTKKMVEVLSTLGLAGKRVLIVLPAKDEKVFLSVRNIPGVGVMAASDLNAYAVADCDVMVFTTDALSRLGKTVQESAA